MFLSFPLSSALAYTETPEAFDRGDIAELFDFGSGIFAALLCGLSLVVVQEDKTEKNLICFDCLWIVCDTDHCITYRPLYARGRILNYRNDFSNHDLCSFILILYSYR